MITSPDQTGGGFHMIKLKDRIREKLREKEKLTRREKAETFFAGDRAYDHRILGRLPVCRSSPAEADYHRLRPARGRQLYCLRKPIRKFMAQEGGHVHAEYQNYDRRRRKPQVASS